MEKRKTESQGGGFNTENTKGTEAAETKRNPSAQSGASWRAARRSRSGKHGGLQLSRYRLVMANSKNGVKQPVLDRGGKFKSQAAHRARRTLTL